MEHMLESLWIEPGDEGHGAQYTKALWPVLREPPEPM